MSRYAKGVLCAAHRLEAISAFAEARRQARATPPSPYASDPLYRQRATQIAAEISGVPLGAITSRARTRTVSRVRWALYVGMASKGVSSTNIGRRFGRDHSTVLYGLRQAREVAARDPAYKAFLDRVVQA